MSLSTLTLILHLYREQRFPNSTKSFNNVCDGNMELKMNNEREEEEEATTSMEEKTILYGYNNDPKNPEETETLLSLNQSKSTTKRYKGVWRKNGRWIARIRNPLTNSRLFLGRFHSSEAALDAYFSKKREFESQLRAAKDSNSVMIDNHGFLLGGFSRLDEDLRICD
ncbi:hypothetical protein L6452_20945 [Arctium lappa]|uniref:Uncharacterized protein n=1 Tax=Arctium lappa TaxID=4217 RepID=A0ACB9BDL0_ARCLA|nr:hypothetical protein L6452_20945 [Arctium lappa]